MKVKINEEIVVGKDEDRMQIEYTQIEPEEEHVEKVEHELCKFLVFCR